jgi:hypothetical protein
MREVFQPESRFVLAEEVRRIRLHRGTVAALGFGPDIQIRLYALAPKDSTAEARGGGHG